MYNEVEKICEDEAFCVRKKSVTLVSNWQKELFTSCDL